MLIDILQCTVSKVKVLNPKDGLLLRRVSPVEAIALVTRDNTYVGETTPTFKRVMSLRKVKTDLRPDSLWIPDLGFWDDRAVLRYSPDMRNIPLKARNKELLAMWNRMLRAHPAPKSWRRP
jgi:hypothetical protein